MAIDKKNWITLNNEIMVKDEDGNFNLNKDKEAVRAFFLDYINVKLRSFLNLREKIDFLIQNNYWVDFFQWYSFKDIKKVVEKAYSYKFRFQSYMAAEKFYKTYALKEDKQDEKGDSTILERYEDRVACVALFLAKDLGVDEAIDYLEVMMEQEYQPATPTFLNAGKARGGELVSCFKGETLIGTDNGEVEIKNLEIGDKVLTHDGSFKEVLDVMKRDYNGEYYELTLEGNYLTLSSTEEHPILGVKREDIGCIRNKETTCTGKVNKAVCVGGTKNYKEDCIHKLTEGITDVVKWNSIKNLNIGDYVAITYNTEVKDGIEYNISDLLDNSYFVREDNKLYKKIIDVRTIKNEDRNYSIQEYSVKNKIKLDEKLGRLIGYYLAEGYIIKKGNVNYGINFTINGDDEYIIKDIVDISNEIFDINPSINKQETNCVDIIIRNKGVGELFNMLCGTHCNLKKLHNDLKYVNKEIQESILIGVLRGDGCATKQGYNLTLTNEGLINELRELFWRVGCEVINHGKGSNGSFYINYSVKNQFDLDFIKKINKDVHKIDTNLDNKIGFTSIKKDGYILYKIKGVYKEEFQGEVYNLEVKDNHTYSVNNFIVHNCFLDEVGDSIDAHAYTVDSAMQLSKIGGGVSFDISKIRGRGESIKGIEGRSSGVLPMMKILEDTFSYVNQLGQRPGSGAVYLNIFHSDIEEFLDCKKINVDEKSRIKSLSIGVNIPDKFMELAEKDEAFYVFYPHTVYQAYGMYLNDLDFDNSNIYNELVENPQVKKKKLSARNLLVKIAQVQKESGYPYIHFKGNTNKVHPLSGLGEVKFSNLCVSGNTKILTDKGYVEIQSVVGTEQNVWNGEEWSDVKIVKTGINQELLNVKTDSGYELNATPYHKFYISTNYNGGFKEVRTSELKEGDKLIKFALPTIEGDKILEKAYTNGFFSGDGTEYTGRDVVNKCYKKIYLYGDKILLKDKIEYEGNWNEYEGRLSSSNVSDLEEKFFIPSSEYSIESRLKWLAGLIDSDGTLTDNNTSQSIQIGSINKDFLIKTSLMLQTLGVLSKVSLMREECIKDLPKNDGTGEYGGYKCKEFYRLLINGNSLFNLGLLGLGKYLGRIKLSFKKPNREASTYIKIKSVSKVEGLHDTYCFTEHKRHMGMFNGILTGNCTEILQVSQLSDLRPRDEVSTYNYGISCNLGSLNIARVMENKSIDRAVQTAMRMLTVVTDVTEIGQVPSIAKANRELHSVGLGAMNLHGFLAKNKIMYESEQALEFVDKFFGIVNYHSILESCEIARERNETFAGFEKSSYADGTYFDKYLADFEETFKFEKVEKLFEGIEIPTLEDWIKLKEAVMQYGLYNAYRLAIAPNQSTSYIMNATASVMPIVDVIETREYGNSTTYYPMPYLNNSNFLYFKSAYDMNQNKVMRLIAKIQKHIDQGISCILHTNSSDSTADLAKYYIVAHKLGLKTLYYTRTRKSSIEECISCSA